MVRARSSILHFSLFCGVLLVLFLVLGAGAPVARSAPGDLDPSFGTDGVATIEGGGSNTAVASAAGGKVVLAFGTGAGVARVMRLTSAGGPDLTFSGDGSVDVPIAGVAGIAIDGTGGVIVASNDSILRLSSSGEFDAGFAGDGVADGFLTGAVRWELRDVAVDGQGRIVVSGEADMTADALSEENDVVVARLEPDGDMDTTFGDGGGVALNTIGSATTRVTASSLAVDGSDRPIVGGTASQSELFQANRGFVMRLTGAGAPDATFGSGGSTILLAPGTISTNGDALARAPDGRLVLAGSGFIDGYGWAIMAARLDTGGQPDAAFGVGGIVVEPVSAPSGRVYDAVSGADVQPDGRILLGANADDPLGFLAVRLEADGDLDPSFASDGLQDAWPLADPGWASDAELTASGELLVAGDGYAAGYVTYVARYLGGGDPVADASDLRVSMSVDDDEPISGDDAAYDLVIGNDGPKAATAVTVTFESDGPMPSEVWSDEATCDPEAYPVTCTIDRLGVGQEVGISATATVSMPFTLTAKVAATRYTDPHADDNRASVTVRPALLQPTPVTPTLPGPVPSPPATGVLPAAPVRPGVFRVVLARTPRLREAIAHGLPLRVTADTAGSVVVEVRPSVSDARRLKLRFVRGKPPVIAKARGHLGTAATGSYRPVFARATKPKLERLKRVRLNVRVMLTHDPGDRVVRSLAVTLRR